jgi:hypothetical protein
VLALCAAEVFLRIKNNAMTNYDIEMWRYANELKKQSDDPWIDFDHRHSRSALLQNTEIRLNSEGLRGPDIAAPQSRQRRILFLGSSITLGWGVAESETVEARLQRMLATGGENAEVLNGGVGNYNTERYVSRFFKELTALKPTDIVVQYFLRDAEELPAGGGIFCSATASWPSPCGSPITAFSIRTATPRWWNTTGVFTIPRLRALSSCRRSCGNWPSTRGTTTSTSTLP